MPKRPFTRIEEPEVETSAPPPVFEAPPVEEAPAVTIVAKDTKNDELAKRLTDYVHHRLNQHLPSAVEFYVQELLDVIAGPR